MTRYEKNVARRKKNKARKLRKQKGEVLSPGKQNEEEKKNPAVGDGVRAGFFFGCSDEVRAELRDSRARLLIARNERELLQERSKLRSLDPESPEALCRDVLRVVGMANALSKKSKDAKIGGWAETIAESMTRSISEGAPSSVPSLESVGYGVSAKSEVSVRKDEYENKLAGLVAAFDASTIEYPGDREAAIAELGMEYADIVHTSAVAARAAQKNAVKDFIKVFDCGTEVKDQMMLKLDSVYSDLNSEATESRFF